MAKVEYNKMKDGLKVYDKHVAFWGSAFSNFYPCKIVIDEQEYRSSEQYFMAMKALHFEDEESYEKILEAKTPKEAKALGRQVKNFDADEWMKVCEEHMHNGVLAKFIQNEDLKDFLLSDEFKGKGFVEGSPIDGIWGVKIHYESPNIDDETQWNGLNLLGKVLNRVREELR